MGRYAGVLLLGLLLLGCGGEPFRLRDSQPIPEVARQGLYLQGVDPRSDLGLALRDGLEEAGVNILAQPTPQAAGLEITGFRENRLVSGYSAARQVREFIHTVALDFTVQAPNLDKVTGTIQAERSQVYDGKYVLGTADEEALIKAALRREAVRLLLLRLRAIRPQ